MSHYCAMIQWVHLQGASMRFDFRYRLTLIVFFIFGLLGFMPKTFAQWDGPIFKGLARLVVTPEADTFLLSGSTPVSLRVSLQNKFPYKLFNVTMRGWASGYNISVLPAAQDIHPSQSVIFTYTISGINGAIPVSTLNLELRIRNDNSGDPSNWPWRASTDDLVYQA